MLLSTLRSLKLHIYIYSHHTRKCVPFYSIFLFSFSCQPNMTMLRGLCCFLTVLMIISNVKGRWLETSDGVHDINDMNQKNDSFLRMSVSDLNPTMLDDASEKRCKSIYGFLPCADTVPEGIFLILMYTYALMLGEECLGKGSDALLIHFSNRDIAGSVFRVLKALPRVVMVIGKLFFTFIDIYNHYFFILGLLGQWFWKIN